MEENNNINEQWGTPDHYFDSSKSKFLNRIVIEEEKSLYPDLYSLKQDVFSLPSDYIVNNGEQLNTEMHLQKLKDISSFITPELYFEENARSIHQKLSFIPLQQVKHSWLRKYSVHSAAAILILSLSIIAYKQFSTVSNNNSQLADLTIVNGIDVEEIEEHDLLEQFNETKTDSDVDALIEMNLDNEDIENAI
jgi:hypothetical protein